MDVKFEKFDEKYLELSWTWLNDPENKFLTNTLDFTKEQQQQWFNSLPGMKGYLIWGIKVDSVAVGACGLKNITDIDCEYWGYIGEKQYWGKGLGKEMLFLLEEEARKSGKSSIWLKVIKENIRAISLYKKFAYKIESETDALFVMRKQL